MSRVAALLDRALLHAALHRALEGLLVAASGEVFLEGGELGDLGAGEGGPDRVVRGVGS